MSHAPGKVFHFGAFRLDVATRELWRNGSAVHLSPKGFQLLACLLEEAPRALSRNELLDRIWAGTFVSEATLTSVVAEVREALEDRARPPKFLRTVHRFGYAFCGKLSLRPAQSGAAGAAVCFLLGEAGEFALVEGENLVGRDGGVSVAIDAATVSRRHARIVVSDRGAVVEDLDSKNGTFVQGRRIAAPADLEDGDRLTIGAVPLVFRVRRGSDSTLTRHSD